MEKWTEAGHAACLDRLLGMMTRWRRSIAADILESVPIGNGHRTRIIATLYIRDNDMISRIGTLAFALAIVTEWTVLAAEPDVKKVVLIAGKASHGYGEHEHRAGCMLLAKALEEGMPGYRATVVTEGWPEDESVFEDADAILMYCDGAGGHVALPHRETVQSLARRGVGIGCIHFAVEVPEGQAGNDFLDWIGGYFELGWSVNPHWTARFDPLPDHPITRGVKPFAINDEWYYHMRFRPDLEGVTPILTARPPESTLSRPDGPRSGNPAVREAVAKGEPQHVAWAYERPDGGRGFGFTGGHFHRNWGDDNFRKLVLNALVWLAQGDVPSEGVVSSTPSEADLEANQDEPKPAS